MLTYILVWFHVCVHVYVCVYALVRLCMHMTVHCGGFTFDCVLKCKHARMRLPCAFVCFLVQRCSAESIMHSMGFLCIVSAQLLFVLNYVMIDYHFSYNLLDTLNITLSSTFIVSFPCILRCIRDKDYCVV